jgi:hypothetical protein
MHSIRLFLIGLLASLSIFEEGTALAQDQPIFSQGQAQTVNSGLVECTGHSSRNSAIGIVTAKDGSKWTVSAPVHFSKSLFANDLYNDCSGNRYEGPQDVDLNAIPIRTQAGGEDVYTAYIFADNYFCILR